MWLFAIPATDIQYERFCFLLLGYLAFARTLAQLKHLRFRPIFDGGVDRAEEHIISAYATLQQGRASIAYLSVMV